MAIAIDTLSIYRGDTLTIQITVTDSDGAAYNLTGYTLTFTAKTSKTGTTLISKSVLCDTAPATGIESITLTSEDTDVTVRNNYDYDIEVRNTDTPNIVHTVARGKLNILQDITTI